MYNPTQLMPSPTPNKSLYILSSFLYSLKPPKNFNYFQETNHSSIPLALGSVLVTVFIFNPAIRLRIKNLFGHSVCARFYSNFGFIAHFFNPTQVSFGSAALCVLKFCGVTLCRVFRFLDAHPQNNKRNPITAPKHF